MRKGFSLVELSIVLVILGLLVGGILAGQTLIHSSELRKTIGDIEKYRTATMAFRDKYFALPGDMANATSFWGAADGNDGLGADCYTVATSGTCNGNADGQLVGGPESYRYWQQLQLAGQLDGGLTGVPGPAPNGSYIDDIPGTNLPVSPLPGALATGYSILYSWSNYTFVTGVSMRRQNALTIAPKGSSFKHLEGGSVYTIDAWRIDTKMDDGAPGSGTNQIYSGYGGGTVTAYSTASTSTTCQPVIGMGF